MVKIRLSRMGAKGQPYYRVVVVDERKKRDGKVLEVIGRYNARTEPSNFDIDQERLKYWTGVGAQMTEPVQVLLGVAKPKRHAEKNTKPEVPVAAPVVAETAEETQEETSSQDEVKAVAPETTPDPSPELAKAEAASEEASVPASPEVVEQVVENSDEIATGQVSENMEPTTGEDKTSTAEDKAESADTEENTPKT